MNYIRQDASECEGGVQDTDTTAKRHAKIIRQQAAKHGEINFASIRQKIIVLYKQYASTNRHALALYYHLIVKYLDTPNTDDKGISALVDIISTLHSRVQALEERNGRN